jgi:hypothetical protein
MLAKAKEEKKELDVVGKKVRFQMIECTRGRTHKVSSYEGERKKLDVPLKIEIKKSTDKPKTIEYKFTNKISKVRDAQAGDKKAVKKAKGVKKAKKVEASKETPKVEAPKVEASKVEASKVVEAPAKKAGASKKTKTTKPVDVKA